MPVLAEMARRSALSGGPGMRGGASRPRPPPPRMRRAGGTGGAELGGWRGGGRAATRKVPPCHRGDSPGRSLGNIPLRSLGSISGRCRESICLSLGMGNIQSFVSLDEVRYSVACHKNIGTKWLPRPPPLSEGGRRDRGSAVPWGGQGPASLGGRPVPCGRADGDTGLRRPAAVPGMLESRVPVPPSRHAHPQVSGPAGAP